jgi:hypothetical protein
MREIYSLAECVYVWLGAGDEAADKAMDYLERCAKMMARLPFEEVVGPTSMLGVGYHICWKMHVTRLRTLKDAPGRYPTLFWNNPSPRTSENFSDDFSKPVLNSFYLGHGPQKECPLIASCLATGSTGYGHSKKLSSQQTQWSCAARSIFPGRT